MARTGYLIESKDRSRLICDGRPRTVSGGRRRKRGHRVLRRVGWPVFIWTSRSAV